MITFDAATHTYRVDGRVIPSVTQILKATGYINDRWYTPGSAERGTQIHAETALIDHGFMQIDDYKNTQYYNYLLAWEKFKKEIGIGNFFYIEKPLYSKRYDFCGTIDRVVKTITGTFILDIKTGVKNKSHELQLNAYRILMDKDFCNLLCVHIKDNGKYSCEDQKLSNDFLDVLSQYRSLQND
jgi:hypothetical protein